jgi:hypothetical protein
MERLRIFLDAPFSEPLSILPTDPEGCLAYLNKLLAERTKTKKPTDEEMAWWYREQAIWEEVNGAGRTTTESNSQLGKQTARRGETPERQFLTRYRGEVSRRCEK